MVKLARKERQLLTKLVKEISSLRGLIEEQNQILRSNGREEE